MVGLVFGTHFVVCVLVCRLLGLCLGGGWAWVRVCGVCGVCVCGACACACVCVVRACVRACVCTCMCMYM